MSIGTNMRGHELLEFVIASGATTSNGVDVSRMAGGALFVAADYDSDTTLVFEASTALDGTYLPLTNTAGTAVGLTITAGKAIEVPEQVWLVPFVRIVIGGAASKAETIQMSSKS